MFHDFEMVDDLQVHLVCFPESDSGIKNDLVICDICFFCDPDALPQIIDHILPKIIVHCFVSIVHQTAYRLIPGSVLCHLAVMLETPDIVNQICARLQCGKGDSSFISIDRNRNIKITLDCFNNRCYPCNLLFLRDHHMSGSGGFTTDIYNICAIADHLLGMPQCCIKIIKFSTIRKGIRCHI